MNFRTDLPLEEMVYEQLNGKKSDLALGDMDVKVSTMLVSAGATLYGSSTSLPRSLISLLKAHSLHMATSFTTQYKVKTEARSCEYQNSVADSRCEYAHLTSNARSTRW